MGKQTVDYEQVGSDLYTRTSDHEHRVGGVSYYSLSEDTYVRGESCKVTMEFALDPNRSRQAVSVRVQYEPSVISPPWTMAIEGACFSSEMREWFRENTRTLFEAFESHLRRKSAKKPPRAQTA